MPRAHASIKSNFAEITYARSLEEEVEFLMESEKSLGASKTGNSLVTLYSVSYSLSAFASFVIVVLQVSINPHTFKLQREQPYNYFIL